MVFPPPIRIHFKSNNRSTKSKMTIVHAERKQNTLIEKQLTQLSQVSSSSSIQIYALLFLLTVSRYRSLLWALSTGYNKIYYMFRLLTILPIIPKPPRVPLYIVAACIYTIFGTKQFLHIIHTWRTKRDYIRTVQKNTIKDRYNIFRTLHKKSRTFAFCEKCQIFLEKCAARTVYGKPRHTNNIV